MDESDERLVEALKSSIAQGRYEVGMDGGAQDAAAPEARGPVRHTTFASSVTGGSGSGEGPLPTDDPVDGAFNKAMNAYRAARAAGDAEAMAKAQAAMQEVVRQEMAAEEQPCRDDAKPKEQAR